jgi:predicted component of type VI protein secretion system
LRTRDYSFFGCFISPEGNQDHEERRVLERDDVDDVILAVEILLNTRSPLSLTVCTNLSRRTVIDYGLPDFLHLSPLSRAASYQLAGVVKDTIDAHEPRLFVTSVDIQLPRPCRDVFRVLITGKIKNINGGLENVTFPVDVK